MINCGTSVPHEITVNDIMLNTCSFITCFLFTKDKPRLQNITPTIMTVVGVN